jgi:hypothetical protein
MGMGALGGLIIAIIYTIVTGKLQLTKKRIVYGTPARMVAAASLLPLIGAFGCIFGMRLVGKPEALGAIVAGIVLSLVLMYAVGWGLAEAPRQ